MPLLPRAIVFLAALAVLPASAAEITTAKGPDGGVVIRISGPIVRSDMWTAWRLLVETEHPPGRPPLVVLDSPGGDLTAGMSIARAVAKAKARSAVPVNGVCASACFLPWIAGVERRVGAGAQVGIHTASEARTETDNAKAATLDMGRAASSYGAPAEIVAAMILTKAHDMRWLSPAEIAAMTGPRP